jgi:hypothetical protein
VNLRTLVDFKETRLLEVLRPPAPFHRGPATTSRIKISTFFSLFFFRKWNRKKTQQTPSTKKAEQTFLPTNFQWRFPFFSQRHLLGLDAIIQIQSPHPQLLVDGSPHRFEDGVNYWQG